MAIVQRVKAEISECVGALLNTGAGGTGGGASVEMIKTLSPGGFELVLIAFVRAMEAMLGRVGELACWRSLC